MKKKEADLLTMPYPFPGQKRVAHLDRAAQFAPFAALTGYDEALYEKARYTEDRMDFLEDQERLINQALVRAIQNLACQPRVHLVYFVPDNKKQGGHYQSLEARIVQWDAPRSQLILDNRQRINIHDLIELVILDAQENFFGDWPDN